MLSLLKPKVEAQNLTINRAGNKKEENTDGYKTTISNKNCIICNYWSDEENVDPGRHIDCRLNYSVPKV